MTTPPKNDPRLEDQHRLLVDSFTDYAIFTLDQEGRVETWNPGAQRIKGYSPEEIVGRTFDAFFPAEDQAEGKPARLLETAVRAGRATDEGWRVRKDGTRFWASVVVAAMRDDTGNVVGFAKITRDMTAERERDVAIAVAEEQFRTVFEQSPIGMAILDAELRYVRVNPALERIVGYDARELIGKKPEELTPEEDRATDAALLAKLMTGEAKTYAREKRYVKKDGSVVDVRLEAAALRGRDGQTAFFLGQIQDITESRNAEVALERERQRFRTLVASAPIGIVEMGPTGEILFANEAWCKMTELSFEEARLPERRARHMHPDDREAVRAAFTAARREGKTASHEFRYDAPSGSHKILVTMITPVREHDGAVRVFIGITLDVTSEREHARAMTRSLHEKEILLKEIHHRVKNNLQVVSSIVNLHGNRSEDEGVRAVLSEVRGRIHAIALLHERLYRSRDLTAIDLDEYINGLVSDAARASGGNSSQLITRTVPVRLNIDAALPVGLIVNELVTNAFKHGATAPSAVRVEVDVAVAADGQVSITVTDDGPGIPDQARREATRSLGLFLVHNLTTQLRGTTVFENNPTRAILTFPLTRESSG